MFKSEGIVELRVFSFTMMRIVAVFCLLLVAVHHTQAGMKEMKLTKEAIFGVLKDCKTKVNPTDADAEEFKKNGFFSSKSAQCYMACILEALGFMVEDKFSKENALTIAEKFFNSDKELVEGSKAAAEECDKDVTASGVKERCDVSREIVKCYRPAVLRLIDMNKSGN